MSRKLISAKVVSKIVISAVPGPDTDTVEWSAGVTEIVSGEPGICGPCMEVAITRYCPDRVNDKANVEVAELVVTGVKPERKPLVT